MSILLKYILLISLTTCVAAPKAEAFSSIDYFVLILSQCFWSQWVIMSSSNSLVPCWISWIRGEKLETQGDVFERPMCEWKIYIK